MEPKPNPVYMQLALLLLEAYGVLWHYDGERNSVCFIRCFQYLIAPTWPKIPTENSAFTVYQ